MRSGRRKILVVAGGLAGILLVRPWHSAGPIRRPAPAAMKDANTAPSKAVGGDLNPPPPSRTVGDVLAELGPRVDDRLRRLCARAGLAYPPSEVVLVGLKAERRLEVWARGNGAFRLIAAYPVQGMSGGAGPKLREGDLQVPEGIYHVARLMPETPFHTALELDYPNEFDRAQAQNEGRANLGGEILIHGGSYSVGCLAMGDSVAEELFVLVGRAGVGRTRVVIVPQEPVGSSFGDASGLELPWIDELYGLLLEELARVRGRTGSASV